METQIIRAHPIGPAPVAYYGECRDCRVVSPAFADPVPAIGWVQAHVAAEHPDLLDEWRAAKDALAEREAVLAKVAVPCPERAPGTISAAAFAEQMRRWWELPARKPPRRKKGSGGTA